MNDKDLIEALENEVDFLRKSNDMLVEQNKKLMDYIIKHDKRNIYRYLREAEE